VAADLSESRNEFADAVDDELHKWDGYFERLQAQTVIRTTSARERAESTISDLRHRRNEIAEDVATARNASADGWPEQRKRIGAARDELEQKADELSAQFD
jgi:seryl-tRNA synthetase